MPTVTLTPAAWYELGGIVDGCAGLLRWVALEQPDVATPQRIAQADLAEHAYARLRPGQPTDLTEPERSALHAVLDENLQLVTPFVTQNQLHPDLIEPALSRLLRLNAARDQLVAVQQQPA